MLAEKKCKLPALPLQAGRSDSTAAWRDGVGRSPYSISPPFHYPSLQAGRSDSAAAWRANLAQENPSAGKGKHLCIPPCGSRSGREDIRGAEEVWIDKLWVVWMSKVFM